LVSWLKISRWGAMTWRILTSARLSPNSRSQRRASRLVDDPILQVVDLVLQPVEDREVRVHECVQERPEEVVGPCSRSGPAPSRRWCAVHGSQSRVWAVSRKVRPRTKSISSVRNVGVVGDGERHEVDVLPGQLQLRALVALLDVLGDQGMEPQLGRDGGRERGRWVDQVTQ